jgi:hypothetical protein
MAGGTGRRGAAPPLWRPARAGRFFLCIHWALDYNLVTKNAFLGTKNFQKGFYGSDSGGCFR